MHLLPLLDTLRDSSNNTNDLTFPGLNMVRATGKDLNFSAKTQKNTQIPQQKVNHMFRTLKNILKSL